jgi:hypothetical protein
MHASRVVAVPRGFAVAIVARELRIGVLVLAGILTYVPRAPHPRTRPMCQGSRLSNALPLSGSRGTDTWSCVMSQLASIFR